MRTATIRSCWLSLAAVAMLLPGCHGDRAEFTTAPPSAASENTHPHLRPAVIFVEYVPTPNDVVDRMLTLAEIGPDDVLYDLGCGDGRILVTAAKTYGCRAKGCDLDPLRIEESRKNAEKNGVADLVTVAQEDLAKVDLTEATVVTLYLSPEVNARLRPHLEQLKPEARIVSHNFPVPGIAHEKKIRMVSDEDNGVHLIYLYRCPLRESGSTG